MTYNKRKINSVADIWTIDVVVDCGNLGILQTIYKIVQTKSSSREFQYNQKNQKKLSVISL